MVEAKRTSRNRSPTRVVKRVKSKSQTDFLSGSRSNGRRPSREDSKLRALSRSRSESPGRRPPNRSRSSDLQRGRKPPNRSRSVGPEGFRRQPPKRARSFGLDRSLGQQQRGRRARSASPSLRLGNRSNHSRASSIASGRGRSSDPASRNRARSRSRSIDRFSDEFINKKYPSQRPEDNGIPRRRMQSFRRMKKQIGGRGKEMSWCQLCQYLTPLAIILGASVGLMFATGNGSIITDKIDDLINSFDNLDLMDPFSGGKAPHWPRNGNGLRVTIINALSDDWDVTFMLATADWKTGQPHAVEINEQDGTYDPNCDAPDGTVIVCNGDYGDLKWRGVNEAMIVGGELVSSTARMNEYYLSNMDKGAWQYTMCHELGHALGLAHTDEDFDNEDLGNCMDYTDNLNANKHPDQSNYDTLFDLYGSISGGGERLVVRQLERDDTQSQSQRTQLNSHLRTAADISATKLSSPGNLPQISVQNLRKRDPLNKESKFDDSDATLEDVGITSTTVPDHIRKRKNEAVQKLFQRMKETHSDDDRHDTPVGHTHRDGWKLVHRRHLGEEHETDLGEGYKIRVQFLLVH